MDDRIQKCIDEEYYCLDLSNIEEENIKKYEEYFNKIVFLDLSSSKLNNLPYLNYNNLLILNIENNNIKESITFDNLEELNCAFNEITEIHSKSIKRLVCNDNKIINVKCDIVEYIDISNNPINYIEYIPSLKHIVSSTKIISKKYNIENVEKIEDYYIVIIKN